MGSTGIDDRVLVVDDEDSLRMVISQVLESDGFEVTSAPNGETALDLFRRDPFPLVITDIVMGRMSGIDLLGEIKAIDETTSVVIMTSHASVETAIRALRHGAYDYLIKPFEDIELISAVAARARETRRLMEQNRVLLEQLKITTAHLESLNVQLRDVAARDGLTGLFNHRSFHQALARALSSVARSGEDLSLILIDVDHFKRFNDTHGHLQGDECLRTVGDILRSQSMSGDTPARYGGEEFVLLLPRAAHAMALERAEALRFQVQARSFPGSATQPVGQVTISAGVSSWPNDGRDASSLIERADERLYRAKHAGRNRVCGSDFISAAAA